MTPPSWEESATSLFIAGRMYIGTDQIVKRFFSILGKFVQVRTIREPFSDTVPLSNGENLEKLRIRRRVAAGFPKAWFTVYWLV
jgi:hypothetical protein